ncbi:MAG: response regulator [Desulfobacterales bacterium]|nr:response regulator [Desulfobacterales bacterium]
MSSRDNLEESSEQEIAGQEGRTGVTNAKILVVEDSPTYLRQILNMLQDLGYRTIAAVDGEEALEKAIREMPDLIMLDIILPKKNGFQVCRQLKTTPATRNIKIIMLTSKTQDSDRFWGLKQGADEYLTKPVAEAVLSANLVRLLSGELKIQSETRKTA